MLTPPFPYSLRAMQLSDVEPVLTISQLSFPTPEKASLFQYELTANKLAHYQSLFRQSDVGSASLVGYAGFWLMGDEVHISTLAVHPAWRGQRLGELLLLNMLFMALGYAARLVTLEVRQTNRAARALYQKYAFVVVGRRRRYYKDTGEDALLMTVEPLDGRYRQFLERQKNDLFAHLAAAPK